MFDLLMQIKVNKYGLKFDIIIIVYQTSDNESPVQIDSAILNVSLYKQTDAL